MAKACCSMLAVQLMYCQVIAIMSLASRIIHTVATIVGAPAHIVAAGVDISSLMLSKHSDMAT